MELFGSRGAGLLAAALAIFAGPLLIMYPTTDNFAVFGATGAASLYCSTRAVRAPGPVRGSLPLEPSRGWRRCRVSTVRF